MHEGLERAFREAQEEGDRLREAEEARAARLRVAEQQRLLKEKQRRERVLAIVEPHLADLAPAVLEKLHQLGIPPGERRGIAYWNLGNELSPRTEARIPATYLAFTEGGHFVSTFPPGGPAFTEDSAQQQLLRHAFFFAKGRPLDSRKPAGPLCVEKQTGRVCVLIEEVDGHPRVLELAEYVGKQLHYLHMHRR